MDGPSKGEGSREHGEESPFPTPPADPNPWNTKSELGTSLCVIVPSGIHP